MHGNIVTASPRPACTIATESLHTPRYLHPSHTPSRHPRRTPRRRLPARVSPAGTPSTSDSDTCRLPRHAAGGRGRVHPLRSRPARRSHQCDARWLSGLWGRLAVWRVHVPRGTQAWPRVCVTVRQAAAASPVPRGRSCSPGWTWMPLPFTCAAAAHAGRQCQDFVCAAGLGPR